MLFLLGVCVQNDQDGEEEDNARTMMESFDSADATMRLNLIMMMPQYFSEMMVVHCS